MSKEAIKEEIREIDSMIFDLEIVKNDLERKLEDYKNEQSILWNIPNDFQFWNNWNIIYNFKNKARRRP